MKKLVSIFLCLQYLIFNPSMAQGEDDFIKTTQNDILLVAGGGIAGAILGLSTLSFVEQPSRHLTNIWTGAAIGVIAGVIYVAYNSAQRGTEDMQASSDFKTHERVAWHNDNAQNLSFSKVRFGTQFWQMNF